MFHHFRVALPLLGTKLQFFTRTLAMPVSGKCPSDRLPKSLLQAKSTPSTQLEGYPFPRTVECQPVILMKCRGHETLNPTAGQGYIWLTHRNVRSPVWHLALWSKQLWDREMSAKFADSIERQVSNSRTPCRFFVIVYKCLLILVTDASTGSLFERRQGFHCAKRKAF